MSREGYVVESLASGTRYATSHPNPSRQKIIRKLRPGETVQGFRPRATRKATPNPGASAEVSPVNARKE